MNLDFIFRCLENIRDYFRRMRNQAKGVDVYWSYVGQDNKGTTARVRAKKDLHGVLPFPKATNKASALGSMPLGQSNYCPICDAHVVTKIESIAVHHMSLKSLSLPLPQRAWDCSLFQK